MRQRRAALLVALLALSGCGSTGLEGRVTEFGAGGPVEGADLTLSRHDCEWDWIGVIPIQHCVWVPLVKTNTDGDGRYALTGFPGDASLQLSVSKAGYLTYLATSLGTEPHHVTTHDVQLYPTPPSAIDELTLQNTKEGINVSWTNPPESNFGGVLLLRWEGEYSGQPEPVHGQQYRPGESPGAGLTVYSGAASSFLDKGVTEGKDYWYRGFSFSDVMVYAKGSDAAKLHHDGTPPPPVTNLTATPQKYSIELQWEGPQEPHRVLVVRSSDAPHDAVPTSGQEHKWHDTLGNGTVVKVVSSSAGSNPKKSYSDSFPDGYVVHYALYAFDDVFNYSEGVTVAALNPASGWNLELVSATISQAKVWDPELGAADQPPDPFVGLQMDCSVPVVTDCSAPLTNTFAPVWSLTTGPHKAHELRGPFCIVVVDQDTGLGCYVGPNELIAKCQVSITDADLLAGSLVIGSCADVTDLKLGFGKAY